MSSPSTPPPTAQLLDDALLKRVVEQALASPRRRTNHNFHSGAEDNPHRFLNAIAEGSYCAPHRHVTPPKAESFLVLRGEVGVLLFDDQGTVTGRYALGRGGLFGIDIPAGVWHTVLSLTATAVCYEVKAGPWHAATDKVFAPWAPREGQAGTAEQLQAWKALFTG